MLRWPGHTQARRDDTHLATSIDVLPTILAATGVAGPKGLPGLNLLDDAAVDKRKSVFGATFTHDATLPTNPSQTLEFRWVVTDEWKLIVPSAQMADRFSTELFHVTVDPNEEKNLAKDDPERTASMMKQLNRWWMP